jgi:predicted nucleotidyltransferase
LFGSLVNENIHEWSDIDLAVIKETDKNFYERLKEVGLLLLPNIAANIIVYTPEEIEIGEGRNSFINKILDEGKVLYDVSQRAN